MEERRLSGNPREAVRSMDSSGRKAREKLENGAVEIMGKKEGEVVQK